jgi:tetratricopeptide (TPR) repeat protein
MGLTLRAMGREAESVTHLERVGRRSSSVVHDPWLLEVQRLASSLEILLSRAGVHIRQGQLDNAIELLEQAAASYPERAVAHRSLGDVYREVGRSQEAVEAYLRATDLDPHDVEAHASLALILLQHGKPDAAEHEAGLALANDSTHAMALVVRATVEMRRGDRSAAIETILSVLERRDDLAAAHVVHGEALAALGRLDDAEAAFARATVLQPDAEYPRRRLDELRRLSTAGGAQS